MVQEGRLHRGSDIVGPSPIYKPQPQLGMAVMEHLELDKVSKQLILMLSRSRPMKSHCMTTCFSCC